MEHIVFHKHKKFKEKSDFYYGKEVFCLADNGGWSIQAPTAKGLWDHNLGLWSGARSLSQ